MSWSFAGRGKSDTSGVPNSINTNAPFLVATETITLGTAVGNRYSSVIDFIPVDKDGKQMPFTVITNTSATNTSGSCVDQLYACHTRGGTFVQINNTLRDCNYADDLHQGTSFLNIDTVTRPRYVDPSYVGAYPYWKIRIKQAGAEKSNRTIGLAIIVGKLDKGKQR